MDHIAIDWETLITAANRAPSGDNTQPWEVLIKGDTLELFYAPEKKEKSYYAVGHITDYIALGEWLHNLKTAAGARGYDTAIDLAAQGDRVAVARLTPKGDRNNGQMETLFARRTNRYPFTKVPLAPEHKSALEGVVAPYGVRIVWIEGEEKSALRDIIPLCHRILWKHPQHRSAVLGILRTGRVEDAEMGIHTSQFGLPFGGAMFAGIGIVLARILPFLQHVTRIILGALDQRNITHAGTLALLVAKAPKGIAIDTHQDFWIHTSMGFEAMWLAATERKLAVQPLYVVIALTLRRFFRLPPLSATYADAEIRVGDLLHRYAQGESDVAFMLLRIGTPTKVPRAYSLRKPLERMVRKGNEMRENL